MRGLKRVYLVEIERQGVVLTAVSSDEILQGEDHLIFAGDTEAISELLRINGISSSADLDPQQALSQNKVGRRLVEAVVSPHCDATSAPRFFAKAEMGPVRRALLIGCVTAGDLASALAALSGYHDVVLAPAEDGGYSLNFSKGFIGDRTRYGKNPSKESGLEIVVS